MILFGTQNKHSPDSAPRLKRGAEQNVRLPESKVNSNNIRIGK